MKIGNLTLFRRLNIWPTLSPGAHFQRPSGWLPFPLDQAGCRIYSLARHAIWNACHALGLQSTDRILVPAFHHGSEIEALLQAGLSIRYYEVTEKLEPDPAVLESLMTPDVRALYLIHYLGFPQNALYWRKWCDERGLLLLEDAAQSFLSTCDGQPVGSFGHMGVFCLYKTYGLPDGAAVITDPPAKLPSLIPSSGTLKQVKHHFYWVAERNAAVGFMNLQLSSIYSKWKNQNKNPSQEFELGDPATPPSKMTSRLLPQVLNKHTAQRRRENYQFLLGNLNKLVPAPFASLPAGASPFAFPLEVSGDARPFIKRLRRYGILGMPFWWNPHPSLPVQDFPRSKALREHIVALPVHQELTRSELQQIVEATYRSWNSKDHTTSQASAERRY